MGYSVYFFAMRADTVATQFATGGPELVNRVEERIRQEQCFSDEDIQSTVAKVAALCRGDLPRNCDPEYFDALSWTAEVVGEKINISSFLDFRHLRYLEEIGIWPWLLRSHPPFAVPVCKRPPPQVGFLSAGDIATVALPSFASLPASDSAEVNYARQEFQEVLESLAEDKLDLLAVLL